MSNESYVIAATPSRERNGIALTFHLFSTRKCQRSPQQTSLPVRVSGVYHYAACKSEACFGVSIVNLGLTMSVLIRGCI